MLAIFVALLPVFLLILLGAGFRRFNFPGGDFWPLIERFSYFVLFPCLLVKELASADLGSFDPLPMVAGLSLGMYLHCATVLLLKRHLRLNGPDFTSVFQGAVRFNTFAGLAAAQALYGSEGVALFAVCVAVMVPQLNIVCVAVLAKYAYGREARWTDQLLLIAKNPLILACVIGIALNLSGLRLPPVAWPVIDALGRAALAFGLLTVGAALDLPAARRASGPIVIAAALKLLLFPLLVALGAWTFGVEGLPRTAMVLWASMPTAPAAYILARQLGGNAELMAAAITATTLGAALTVAPVLLLLG